MDWNPIQSLLDANLDQLVAKASDPKATLGALARKIASAAESVEAHIAALDDRAIELPALLTTEDAMVAKVQAIVAKAENDGRPDLAAAAKARLAKTEAQRQALQAESDQNDAERTRAEDILAKLQERSLDLEARGAVILPAPAAPAPAPAAVTPKPAPAPAPVAAKPAPAPAPVAAKPAPAPAPKPAAPAAPKKGGGALDDEFDKLLSDLNVDLAQVDLPKKPGKGLPVPSKDDDLGIPDLVTVGDNELPDGEELEPLPVAPAKGKAAPAAKPGAAPAAPAKPGAASTPAKPGAPGAAGKPGVPAVAPKPGMPAAGSAASTGEAPKRSKRWVWISLGATALGAGGVAIAHFALHLF